MTGSKRPTARTARPPARMDGQGRSARAPTTDPSPPCNQVVVFYNMPSTVDASAIQQWCCDRGVKAIESLKSGSGKFATLSKPKTWSLTLSTRQKAQEAVEQLNGQMMGGTCIRAMPKLPRLETCIFQTVAASEDHEARCRGIRGAVDFVYLAALGRRYLKFRCARMAKEAAKALEGATYAPYESLDFASVQDLTASRAVRAHLHLAPGAGIIVVNNQGQGLLARRRVYHDSRGFKSGGDLTLPGGIYDINDGERNTPGSVVATAVREFAEETSYGAESAYWTPDDKAALAEGITSPNARLFFHPSGRFAVFLLRLSSLEELLADKIAGAAAAMMEEAADTPNPEIESLHWVAMDSLVQPAASKPTVTLPSGVKVPLRGYMHNLMNTPAVSTWMNW